MWDWRANGHYLEHAHTRTHTCTVHVGNHKHQSHVFSNSVISDGVGDCE